MKDYYNILGVERNADADTIKKNYRKLAQQWHPDKNPDNIKVSEEKFKEISEAYSVLSDPDKKRNYDMTGSPEGRGGFGPGFRTTGFPFDIFWNMADMRNAQQPRSMRGQNIELGVNLTLYEALFGTEKSITYQTTSPCLVCGGKGGTEFITCGECNGLGMKINRQHNMVVQTTCRACGGQGMSIKTPCGTCNGQKIISEEQHLSVVFPPGIKHKTALRLSGKGGRGFNGGPSGDVFIHINIDYPKIENLSEEDRKALAEILSKT